MRISPDDLVFWQYGFVRIDLTIVTTWGVMVLLTALSLFSYFSFKKMKSSKGQVMVELLVDVIQEQIKEIGLEEPERYLGFIGTLFLFIVTSNILIIIPWYEAPTGSISTTIALAVCVFFAVPVFGISQQGILRYLKSYIEPTFIMLPFNIISELTRTIALAIRLFGNIMSGTLIVSILIGLTPFIFPVIMTILGLLTGMVQAYIFTVLATVYIAAASRIKEK
jgi:F-type H+-transporting ATPase subunit a